MPRAMLRTMQGLCMPGCPAAMCSLTSPLSYLCWCAPSLGRPVKFRIQGLRVAFSPLAAWKGGGGKNLQSKWQDGKSGRIWIKLLAPLRSDE